MSQFSGHSNKDSISSTPNSSPPPDGPNPLRASIPHRKTTPIVPPLDTSSPVHPSSPIDTPITNSPQGRNRSNSGRPLSIVQTFQPPIMDVGDDTIPELLPIFTFLNSHSNKLYQEGYFLKLDDQNTRALARAYFVSLFVPSNNFCRWTPQPRQDVDRVLCSARRHCIVTMGRRRTGRSRRGWRGAAEIHQPDRCLH